MSHLALSHSPVKFVGADCWPRGPTLSGRAPEQPMDVSTAEQMDTSGGGEASAPLPIRHPSGINAGPPYKKQAYPMNSKRPEHLRMNL